jgi:hypothetical protein
MNPPSASRPEPQASPASRIAQENRAARLDELLARQRIASQPGELNGRPAENTPRESSGKLSTGPTPGNRQQAEARDQAELEL